MFHRGEHPHSVDYWAIWTHLRRSIDFQRHLTHTDYMDTQTTDTATAEWIASWVALDLFGDE